MTLIKKQIEKKGFIVINNVIEETNYRSYLLDYGCDETTTPNGVAPRMHIREHVIDIEEGGEEVVEYQIWSWGVNGNNPYFTGQSLDNEDDAEIYIYEYFENYIQNNNWDAPTFYNTKIEAIDYIADSMNKDAEVIVRWLSLCEYAKTK